MKSENKRLSIPDVRPPNPPWQPIKGDLKNQATITFYYGDAKSTIIPIRDVTNKKYAKQDPNFETLTYGLFSHCCKSERKSIVEKGIGTQFFCTSRANRTRVLTGYYHPRWYCKIDDGDNAIAADSARFVSPGFVLSDLVSFLGDYRIDNFFRTWKYIREEKIVKLLLLLINSAPDATAEYVSEIHNLEAYALKEYGQIYSNRSTGFSWKYAGELMKKWGLI